MSTPMSAELFAEVAIKFSEAIHDIAALVASHANVPFEPSYLKPKDGKKKRIVDPNAPKRPPTAYFLFSAHVRKTNPNETLSVKDISALWSGMTDAQKASYEQTASAALDAWRKEMDEYRATNGTPAVEVPAESSSSSSDSEEETPAPKRAKVVVPVVAAPVEEAPKKEKKEKKPKVEKPAATPAAEKATEAAPAEGKKKKEKKEKQVAA